MKVCSLAHKIRFNLQRAHFIFKGAFMKSDFFEQEEKIESIIPLKKKTNKISNIDDPIIDFHSKFQTFPMANERETPNKIKEISRFLKDLENNSALYKQLPKKLFDLSKIKEEETRNDFFVKLRLYIESNLSLFSVNELCLIFYSLSKFRENTDECLLNIFNSIVHKKHFFIDDYYIIFQGVINLKNNQKFFSEAKEIFKKDFLNQILLDGKENHTFLIDLLIYINYIEFEDFKILENVLIIIENKLKFLNKAEFLKIIWFFTSFKENILAKKKKLFKDEDLIWKIKETIPEMDLLEINSVIRALKILNIPLDIELKRSINNKINKILIKQLGRIKLPTICDSFELFRENLGKQNYLRMLNFIEKQIPLIGKDNFIPVLNIFLSLPRNLKDKMLTQIERVIEINYEYFDINTSIFLLSFGFLSKAKNIILEDICTKKIAQFTQKDFLNFSFSLKKNRKKLSPSAREALISSLALKIQEIDFLNLCIIINNLSPFFDENNINEKNILEQFQTKFIASINFYATEILKYENEITNGLAALSHFLTIKTPWELLEYHIINFFQTFSHHNQVELIEIAAKIRSKKAIDFIQKAILKDLKLLREDHLIELLQKVECINSEDINENFWKNIEKEIIDRLQDNRLNLTCLSHLLFTMKTNHDGSAVFWTTIYKLIESKNLLSDIDPKKFKSRNSLIYFITVSRKNNKLSEKFMTNVFSYILEISRQDILVTREVYEICLACSKIKINDNELWFNLENHIMKVFERFPLQSLIDLIVSFSIVKKGSKDFWENCNKLLLNNQENIDDFKLIHLLKAIKSENSFDIKKWGEFIHIKLENNIKDPKKFILYMLALSKNQEVLESLKGFDSSNLIKIWQKTFRFNLEDEEKRKKIDSCFHYLES